MDFRFISRRIFFQVLAVVGELREIVALDMTERVRQCHFSPAMVMAVGFAVGADVDQLIPIPLIGKCAHDSSGKLFARIEQLLECDRLRNGSIIEEQRD